MEEKEHRASLSPKLGYVGTDLGVLPAEWKVVSVADAGDAAQVSDREDLHMWDRRCILKRLERGARPVVNLERNRLAMQIRPAGQESARHRLIDAWCQAQLRAALLAFITKQPAEMHLHVRRVFVQRMKTT